MNSGLLTEVVIGAPGWVLAAFMFYFYRSAMEQFAAEYMDIVKQNARAITELTEVMRSINEAQDRKGQD